VVFFPALVPVLLSRWARPAADFPTASAAGTYRADRRTCLACALVYAVPAALLTALVAGAVAAQATNQFGVRPALCWGLAAGAGVWIVAWVTGGQVPLLKLTELVLGSRPGGRARFMRLLEDALGRQVLRQAGSVYQFRHGALQSRLAGRYAGEAGTIPADPRRAGPAPADRRGLENVTGGAG
jgi:hypothetical protein